MLTVMSRTRLIIDTEKEIQLAVKLAATKAGLGVSEFVNSILRKELAAEIRDARRYIPKQEPEEDR